MVCYVVSQCDVGEAKFVVLHFLRHPAMDDVYLLTHPGCLLKSTKSKTRFVITIHLGVGPSTANQVAAITCEATWNPLHIERLIGPQSPWWRVPLSSASWTPTWPMHYHLELQHILMYLSCSLVVTAFIPAHVRLWTSNRVLTYYGLHRNTCKEAKSEVGYTCAVSFSLACIAP